MSVTGSSSSRPVEERDVSGGASLQRRHGLRQAVGLVERGGANVIVAAYFDRLVRSLKVQDQLVSRVEQAGGQVLAVDVGQVTNGSAGQWLSRTMLGAVAEYARRVRAERTQDAKRRAVERGVPPFPNVPPGYRRTKDGRLEPHAKEARIVAEAFRLRATGATVREVREYLRRHGIERSFHGVQALLGSRVVLGELRFGELVNAAAHPAIVDPATWQKVQRQRSPRGRRAKSERLLARLGVMRCGTCGARMVVGTVNNGRYHMYRCPPVGDCPQRVTISAEIAESTVVDAVKDLLDGMRGSASVGGMGGLVADAEREFAQAEQALDAAVRAFDGLEDVAAATEKLTELRVRRDDARGKLADLQDAAAPAGTVSAGDWDDLTVDEQRALIAAVIVRADVRAGRGHDRIAVQPRT